MDGAQSDDLLNLAKSWVALVADWSDDDAWSLIERFEVANGSMDAPGQNEATQIQLILADICARLGRANRAEWHLRRALRFAPSGTLGLMAVSSLASFLERRGRYEDSIALYLEGIRAARELTSGSADPISTRDRDLLAMMLSTAGSLYLEQGNFGDAELILSEAAELYEAGQCTNTIVMRGVLASLSLLYTRLGNHKKAFALSEKQVELSDSAGDRHAYIMDLASMGWKSLPGDSEIAAQYLDRAVKLFEMEEWPPKRKRDALIEFAHAYRSLGNLKSATSCLTRALEVGGYTRAVEADIYSRLAEIHVATESLDTALGYIDQLMGILGGDSQYMAALCSAQILSASVHRQRGDLIRAQQCAREAVAMPGPTIQRARTLRELSRVLFLAGESADALTCLEQAAGIEDSLVDEIFAVGSRAQYGTFLPSVMGTLRLTLTMAVVDPAFIPQAFALFLRRKAWDTSATAARSRALANAEDPDLVEAIRAVETLRAEVASETIKCLPPHGPSPGLAVLNEELEKAEKHIARKLDEMGTLGSHSVTDSSAIARSLPNDSVLVDFVQFDREDLVSALGEPKATYAAFVLRSGGSEKVDLVSLGRSEEIDEAVANYRAAMDRGYSDTGSNLSDAESELYRILVQPILTFIRGCRNIYFSPDSELNHVPFHALACCDGERLVDLYRISYLTAGRDLLGLEATTGGCGPPVVVADPDYDLGSASELPIPATESDQSRALPKLVRQFSTLPGSRREGIEIAAQLGIVPKIGSSAVKSAILGLDSPQVLHIATHGFFLPFDDVAADVDDDDPLQSREIDAGWDLRRGLENPLLRCGLALAGANTWLHYGTPHPDTGDGILNGEEAALLHLQNTQLVVLSACDTGLGDVHRAQGVIGLAHAFLLAGARTVIASLWKVPDVPTRIMMRSMYTRLISGMSRGESLRQAQENVRALYPHPRNWAAFICVGAVGPIQIDGL